MSLAQVEPEHNPAPSDEIAIGDRLRVMFEHVDRGLARLDDIACCVPLHRGAGRNPECRHGDRSPGDPELQRKPNDRRFSWMIQETANPWFLTLAEELRGTAAGIEEIIDDTLAPFGLVGPRFDEGEGTWPSAAHAARDLLRATREAIAAADEVAARRPAPSPFTYSRDDAERDENANLRRNRARARTPERRAAIRQECSRLRAERFNMDWDEAIQTEHRYAMERARFGRTLTDDEHQQRAAQSAAAELHGRRRNQLLYALAAVCRKFPEEMRRRISAELAVEVEKLRLTTDSHASDATTVAQAEPTHSEDFAMVNWFGITYSFNTTQARCIGLLWAEWEKGGLGLNQRTIGDAIDAITDNYRLVHTFRDHAAWGTMIQQERDGVFRLVEPTK